MEKGKGKPAGRLYVFLLLVPFVIGGYQVWCSALAVCILLIILCCGREDGTGERKGRRNCFDDVMVPLISLPVMLLAAGLWGVDRGQAWFGFVKFLPLPLFLAAVRRLPEKGRGELWDAVSSGGIAMTVASATMWCIPATRDWVQVNGRLAGFFQYPNAYAMYLLCGILVRMERPSGKGRRDAAGYVVLTAGLLFSGSRTVLVLAGAVLAALLWQNRGKVRIGRVLLILAGGLFLLVLLLATTGNLRVLERYLILPVHSSTFLGRLLYAADALPVIAGHPLGLGYLGYYFLQGSFQTGVYATRHVHNEFLQLLLDVGWLPAAFMLYALWRTFRRLEYYKRLMLVVLLCHSLFDFDFQFLCLGCILALLMGEEEPGQADSSFGRAERKGIREMGRRQQRICLMKLLSALGLAFLCLWVGAAAFLAYLKQPETVIRIYPAHTESWMALLAEAEEPEEMNRIANRIFQYNQSVSFAYDAKAAVAYSEGDAQKMVDYKLKAIGLARYEMEKYEDYFAKLFTLLQLYQDAGMTRSADYCREKLLEIPGILEQVKDSSSPLAWEIYDKPQLDLPEEMQAVLDFLH